MNKKQSKFSHEVVERVVRRAHEQRDLADATERLALQCYIHSFKQ